MSNTTSMSAQQTPGPWGRRVDKTGAVTVHDATGNDICAMGGNTNDGANGRLIAAAPELLAALLALQKAVADRNYWAVENSFTGGYSQAALAKATGSAG